MVYLIGLSIYNIVFVNSYDKFSFGHKNKVVIVKRIYPEMFDFSENYCELTEIVKK